VQGWLRSSGFSALSDPWCCGSSFAGLWGMIRTMEVDVLGGLGQISAQEVADLALLVSTCDDDMDRSRFGTVLVKL